MQVELDVEVRAVARDFQRPWLAIVDSGTPAICSAVVPPQRNEWPE